MPDFGLPLLPFVAILGLAAILWFATHKAAMTRLESIFQGEIAQLKAHLASNPAVQKVEAAAAPAIKASLDDLHQKVDAIRVAVGGAITDAEKSEFAQQLDAGVKAAEDVFIKLSAIVQDAQQLRTVASGAAGAPASVSGSAAPR